MANWRDLDLESPNHCPNCNNGLMKFISGDFPTGVVAPDGAQETLYEEGYQCDRCGHVEEKEG